MRSREPGTSNQSDNLKRSENLGPNGIGGPVPEGPGNPRYRTKSNTQSSRIDLPSQGDPASRLNTDNYKD